MNTNELKTIAESVENSLYRMVVDKKIANYHATITPDGQDLQVWTTPITPIKFIKVNVVVTRGLNKQN